MFFRFFDVKTKSITLSAGILAISTIVSGILSLIGDWLLAKNFGASLDLDIYFAAFRIPDFIYNILIVGGVIVAFLPLFSEYFSKNEKEAWDFYSNLLNVFLFSLISLSLILFIFTPFLIKFVTPGFGPEQIKKTILLTRILLLSPIILGVSNILSGILQYFNRFLIYSLSPVLYQLGIIFGILILTPYLGILGVVLGVILGCLLHFLIQVPVVKICGFKYKKIFNFQDSGIKRAFLLILPRSLGVLAHQAKIIMITAIASTLTPGSITIFNFANNIQNFPISIIGVSFAVAIFPVLSRALVRNQKDEFIKNFSSTFRQIFFLIIPVSILIFLLRNQITMILLRHGQFSIEAAKLTAASLGLFCLGIFATALLSLIFRAFFSFQDTKTPAFIAISNLALNAILIFYFSWLLKSTTGIRFQNFLKSSFTLMEISDISLLSLPLAFSISEIFQFLISIPLLQKKINFNLKEIWNSFLKIILASSFMILSVKIILNLPLFNSQTLSSNLLSTLTSGLLGISVYFIFAFLLKLPELKEILLFEKL